MFVTLRKFNKVNDRRITKCSVLILKSCTTNLYSICKGLFDVSSCCIKYEILVAKFLNSCCSII